jgi:hypothetical protein
MAHTLTIASVAGVLTALVVLLMRRARRQPVLVSIRLDHATPGAHLIWEILNQGRAPVTLTKLIIHSKTGAVDSWPLTIPKLLAPADRLLVPTDVDWSLLGARTIAVGDTDGAEHQASGRQLADIQDQLHDLIDRRVYVRSAQDWLFGAANLAFGVVILGLGFFMLMWTLATD